MKTFTNPPKETWSELLQRPTQSVESLEEAVNTIFDDVKLNGDSGINRYTALFDGAAIATPLVSKEELDEANSLVSEELKDAIAQAKENIAEFHGAQKTDIVRVETSSGVQCWQEKRAIQKVGLYIPGGTAPLFSSVLMLAIPAQLAGCDEIVLCTPPNKEGKINAAILYAAQLCGVTKIIKAGGIQAVAGMTFGTASIPAVYKIFGPGNQYVTAAKQKATHYGVAIDMPAGPSELLVVADNSANPAFVASDLLSQAEHGTDSQVILVSTSEQLLGNVKQEIDLQLTKLSRRGIAEQAIANSKMIYMDSKENALGLINEYGPEHFIICTEDSDYFSSGIINAGSVFIGDYTPESAGDYASGTNHTLPTNGAAKAYSGVNLDAFLKAITFQNISKQGLENIGPAIELMADAEGLDAHRNAVSLRLKTINQ